ncbi:hypothetical protein T484DRAFT_1892181 [Baffinella frigidus]|nr:hypothetical protein T484DRAFT_1892181 [Cryptophyta sp. CCMP2293]
MSGDVAMGGVDPPVGDQRPGKRLKVELEPLPLDKVDRINPDGSVTLLRPDNPEEVFARKIADLRAKEDKETAATKAAAAAEKAGKGAAAAAVDGFVWKDAVDSTRAATHHARQLSTVLDLLAKRTLMLSRTQPPRRAPLDVSVEGRVRHLERARAAISAAAARLQGEMKVDARFLEQLAVLRENWNVKPLGRASSGAPAGPPGALSVSLALSSAGSTLPHDCDAVILRSADGTLDVKMGPDFKLRRTMIIVDPRHVPGVEAEVGPECVAAAAAGGGDAAGINSYLMRCLSSVLADDLFRTISQV